MNEYTKIEYTTKLSGAAQILLGAQDDAEKSNRYRDTGVKDIVDDMTVADIRTVAVELDQELARMHNMQTRINQLKDKLKEVVGV